MKLPSILILVAFCSQKVIAESSSMLDLAICHDATFSDEGYDWSCANLIDGNGLFLGSHINQEKNPSFTFTMTQQRRI